MFIGHFGVALAAKRVAPRPSLGTLVLAAVLVDGVWPLFVLLGWEPSADRPRDYRRDVLVVCIVPIYT